jgi:transcriptional regulator with XRE-family HTH domain
MALAGAIGVTFQQVQKYEKGTNRVSASRLTDIAAVLDVAPSYFFEDMPDREDVARTPAVDKELADFLSSAEGLALNRAFARIENQVVRRRVVGLVKSLAGQVEPSLEEETA